MTHAAGDLVQSVDWVALAPPTIVAVAALALLVADLFLSERRKPLLGWGAVLALLLAGLALLPQRGDHRETFCLVADEAACSYTADTFTLSIQLLVLGAAFVTALMSITTVRETELPPGEYWFLLFAATAGATLLPAARDLATLVIALEVTSLPVFALIALRSGDRKGSEAALKFFLSSVAATAVTLMGVSFLYAASGSLHLRKVAASLADLDPQLETVATAGAVFTLVGFAFKTALVPFHFWVPETYVGAPVPVAAFLSVVGKAVGFVGLILLTLLVFAGHAHWWAPAIAVLAALTMTVGNLAALRQRAETRYSAVRLLAWSSVGQAGYLIVPLAAAGYLIDENPLRTVGATVTYALMYAAVNLGAFAVVAHVGRGAPGNRITDYRGLYIRHPWAALALGFFLLCLAGLPPGVIGLFAKVAVFGTAVDAGLGWLAVVMAVNVVFGLVYYLRWTAVLFQPAPHAQPAPAAAGGRAPGTSDTVDAGEPPVITGLAPASTVTTSRVHPAADVALVDPSRPTVATALAVALTALVGLVLSVAPQLVLRFASTTFF